MSAAPDPGFVFWTHGSRRVDRLGILVELRDEQRHRIDYYPRAVAQGRMSEMEQQHELNLIAALIEEFAWEQGRPRPKNGFGWALKVNALRREIMMRRNLYPKWTARGRVTAKDAMRKLIAIEAAHAWYWHHGLDFMEGADADEIRANIRAELCRREAWAREQGLDPIATDAIFTGDWAGCPKLKEEFAA